MMSRDKKRQNQQNRDVKTEEKRKDQTIQIRIRDETTK